ncbi:hypothetical protein [Sphingomonas aquatica]|uniref:hypothetical protein n=1 Tax=Sphingomonas aquatica TaxID=1763824 RepID=UPI001921E6E5
MGVGTTAVVWVLVPCGEQPPMISADASNLAFDVIATPTSPPRRANGHPLRDSGSDML